MKRRDVNEMGGQLYGAGKGIFRIELNNFYKFQEMSINMLHDSEPFFDYDFIQLKFH